MTARPRPIATLAIVIALGLIVGTVSVQFFAAFNEQMAQEK